MGRKLSDHLARPWSRVSVGKTFPPRRRLGWNHTLAAHGGRMMKKSILTIGMVVLGLAAGRTPAQGADLAEMPRGRGNWHRMTAGRRSALRLTPRPPIPLRLLLRSRSHRPARRQPPPANRPQRPQRAQAVDPSRTESPQGPRNPTVRLARTGRGLQLAQSHESMERAGLSPTTAATSMK